MIWKLLSATKFVILDYNKVKWPHCLPVCNLLSIVIFLQLILVGGNESHSSSAMISKPSNYQCCTVKYHPVEKLEWCECSPSNQSLYQCSALSLHSAMWFLAVNHVLSLYLKYSYLSPGHPHNAGLCCKKTVQCSVALSSRRRCPALYRTERRRPARPGSVQP